jgi:hypothetical protein
MIDGWRAREETDVTAPRPLDWRLRVERQRLMLLQHLMIKESTRSQRPLSRNSSVTSPRFTPAQLPEHSRFALAIIADSIRPHSYPVTP